MNLIPPFVNSIGGFFCPINTLFRMSLNFAFFSFFCLFVCQLEKFSIHLFQLIKININ